ncbi:AMP-binding protein [Siccirubricoccus deserti]
MTGNITVLRPDQHSLAEDAGGIPIGSCGSARTGMEIAILDDAGQRLPPGETGEICVRGAAVFAGYFEIRRRTRRPSAAAGSTPATSAPWMRAASSASPAGHPTCTYRVAATSIRARWRRRS